MSDTPIVYGAAAASPAAPLLAVTPSAALFDVDYTLLQPNELFLAPGYRRMGERFGLELDETRWAEAERAAYAAVKARRQRLGLAHDDGVYEVIAEAVITALGGGDPAIVNACAAAVIGEWRRCENFTLYDDVLPCFARLRAAGIKIGLVSNTNRDLDEVLAHFALADWVDAAVTSCAVGEMKPSPLIFATALAALDIQAAEAVMIGDSVEDDVRGALACGLAALLLDRTGRFGPGRPAGDLPVIRSLAELPAALRLG
jgi:FMN phosphatase YigB (HAD superfamily)